MTPSLNKRQTKLYQEYLQTLQWGVKRAAALARARLKCERCPLTQGLEVHHKHYDTLFDERPEDLEVLCKSCHDRADEERVRRTRRQNAIRTFARKKYGEGWQDVDYETLQQEFDHWLEWRTED